MFGRIDHVIVMVSDMARSVEFYQNVMGFKLRFRSENWSELDAGNVAFALHGGGAPPTAQDSEPHRSVAGTASISFDVDDVDEIHRQLSGKGVSFTLPPTLRPGEGIKLAVARDLDGFEMCFAQRV